jgi:leucyl aminopeptidase
MKEIIEVSVAARKAEPQQYKGQLLAVGLFSAVKSLDNVCKQLDKKLDGAISRLMGLGDFKAKPKTTAVVYGSGRIGAERVLLVGLGEKKKADTDTLRQASATAANTAVKMRLDKIGLAVHSVFGGRFDADLAGQVCAEGAYFGSYRYDEYVGENEDGRADKLSVEIIEPDAARLKKLSSGLLRGSAIGGAQSYTRTVANRPANVINPASLAAEAKKLANRTAGLSCTVFDEKQLADKGMGGILAVGAGSSNKPRLIVLKYNGCKSESRKPRVGLVGKAITFDSGGISIKPAERMDQMKLDKSGGIAVLGTMKAAAELKLPLNIIGIIPAAENLPSGTSYRPGDIITTYSGKTVEVQNTDAEGRMILCDALAYAVEQKCDVIIDIATLTGACLVALGKHKAAVMSNDDKLSKQLQAAAERSGEALWPMPCGDEYAEEMKSKIADLKNTGSRWGGACTGAAFLRQFVDDKKWAHLDIAGMDIYEKESEMSTGGSRGFGVRLLTSYLMGI